VTFAWKIDDVLYTQQDPLWIDTGRRGVPGSADRRENMMADQEDKKRSTLVLQGEDAETFREMVRFAESVEVRPLTKLLEELPDLARLSEGKFSLAVSVLRRRFRKELQVNRDQLQVFGEEIALSVEDSAIADKIRTIFK